MISWFFLCLLTVSLLYFFGLATRRWSYYGKHPPGPIPLPIVGSLFELGHLPHRSLARLAKIHGPVMRLELGQTPTVIISSSDAAREVLQKHDQFLSARTTPDNVKALDHHKASFLWLPPSHQHWKHVRGILRTRLFNSQSLDANRALRRRKVQELIEYVRGRIGQEVDVGRAALFTTINQLSNAFFSVDFVNPNEDTAQEFTDIVLTLMEELGSPNLSDFFPLLAPFDPQGHRRRTALYLKKLYRFFDVIIDRRLLDLAREENPPNSGPDFLDALLKLHLQGKSELDRPGIRSILVV